MRYYAALCAFCFFFSNGISQNASFSGQINTYYAITSIDYCNGIITVDDASNLSTNDRVLIIQMQGALINENNNASFGNIEDIRSCGLFEFGAIESINNNEITLQSTLANSYNIDGKIQLIQIPTAENASVDAPVNAMPWNGTTGGVVAIWLDNELSLNANIQTDGQGFRGGNPDINDNNDCTWLVNQDDYFYGLNNWRGARKGEGIALLISGKEAGRGAQATGGGGGNDHNAGGGGGANISAGGNGGVNDEPSFFGCDGDFPGIGGKTFNTNNRAFLGGGGGAGHENNNTATAGGNGGGIIIIKAQNIIANGFSLSTNGISAANTAGEGAGGGGAAGTIVLDVESIGDLPISLIGGNGGNIDNQNQGRCHGPGGGGSGGHLLHTFANNPTPQIDGGNAGMSTNSGDNGCPDSTNGAGNGNQGQINTLDSIPSSDIPNVSPMIISQSTLLEACEGDQISLIVETNRPDLEFQWQYDEGNGFEDIQDGLVFSGSTTNELIIDGIDFSFESFTFQLVISSSCFDNIISAPIQITVQEAPTPVFSFNEIALSVQFTNESQNADAYLWDFGDSQTSTDENPVHLYDQDGQYDVVLCAINDCDTVCTTQTIQLLSTPTATFSASPTSGCIPFSVQFNNLSSGNPNEFSWEFPSGTPSTSTLENPVITYNTVGIFNVTFSATNAAGSDEITLENYIEANDIPEVNFNFSVNNLDVSFTNLSANATSYLWEFGDNQTSTDPIPDHTYAQDGVYTVVLTAFNACGSNSTAQTITVGAAPVAAFTVVTPNGCDPHTAIFSDQSSGNFDTYLWSFPGGVPNTSSDPNPIITYPNVGTYNVTLTVSGSLGSNTFELEEAVIVIPKPEPAFDFEINGNEVTFTNNSTNATSYTWDFGDSATSFEENPTHTYATPGFYTVSLNAQNAFCGSVSMVTLHIMTTQTQNIQDDTIEIFPNPVSQELFIKSNQSGIGKIFTISGDLLMNFQFNQNHQLDLSTLPSGSFLMQLNTSEGLVYKKFIKI